MPRNDSNIERQILWYKSSQSPNQFADEGGERHTFNFLLINTRDQIDLIRQKIFDYLKPMLTEPKVIDGKIVNSVLSYELLSIICNENHYLNFSQIYRGRAKMDRNLQPRKTEDGWSGLLERLSKGQI